MDNGLKIDRKIKTNRIFSDYKEVIQRSKCILIYNGILLAVVLAMD